MHGTISRVERRYLLMRESNQGAVAAGLLFICLLAVGVYSCAVNPVTGRSELALISFSEEEEAALGAKAYTPAVQQQGGFYRDRELEAYVQDVGMRLGRGSPRAPPAPHLPVPGSNLLGPQPLPPPRRVHRHHPGSARRPFQRGGSGRRTGPRDGTRDGKAFVGRLSAGVGGECARHRGRVAAGGGGG